MQRIISELIQRYGSETPAWFKNIGYISALVAIVCASLLGQSNYPLPVNIETWIGKIGMAATAVVAIAFSAKTDNSKPQNPQ